MNTQQYVDAQATLTYRAVTIASLIPELSAFVLSDEYNKDNTPRTIVTDGQTRISFTEYNPGRLTVFVSTKVQNIVYCPSTFPTPEITISFAQSDAKIADIISSTYRKTFKDYTNERENDVRDRKNAENNARIVASMSKNTLNFTHTQKQTSAPDGARYELYGTNESFKTGAICFDIGVNSANINLSSIPVELAAIIARAIGDYSEKCKEAKDTV